MDNFTFTTPRICDYGGDLSKRGIPPKSGGEA